jgi:hypothetical protein
VDRPERLVAAEDVGLPVLADLGRREDDVARVGDRFDQLVVDRRVLRGLGELDVVDDHLRAVLLQPGDQVGVERPEVLPAFLQVAERLVVDLDDDDVVGCALVAADGEACVDRAQIEVAEDVRPVRDQAETRHRHADGEEERNTQPGGGGGRSGHRIECVREASPRTSRSGLAASGGAGWGSPRGARAR